jgi:hypothetical protein
VFGLSALEQNVSQVREHWRLGRLLAVPVPFLLPPPPPDLGRHSGPLVEGKDHRWVAAPVRRVRTLLSQCIPLVHRTLKPQDRVNGPLRIPQRFVRLPDDVNTRHATESAYLVRVAHFRLSVRVAGALPVDEEHQGAVPDEPGGRHRDECRLTPSRTSRDHYVRRLSFKVDELRLMTAQLQTGEHAEHGAGVPPGVNPGRSALRVVEVQTQPAGWNRKVRPPVSRQPLIENPGHLGELGGRTGKVRRYVDPHPGIGMLRPVPEPDPPPRRPVRRQAERPRQRQVQNRVQLGGTGGVRVPREPHQAGDKNRRGHQAGRAPALTRHPQVDQVQRAQHDGQADHPGRGAPAVQQARRADRRQATAATRAAPERRRRHLAGSRAYDGTAPSSAQRSHPQKPADHVRCALPVSAQSASPT